MGRSAAAAGPSKETRPPGVAATASLSAAAAGLEPLDIRRRSAPRNSQVAGDEATRMDLSLTPEQKQIREMVADFVDEEVVPRAADIDENDEFPWDLVEQLADLDLMGMPFPEEYGGAGLDYHA